jgi:hypothetical protein
MPFEDPTAEDRPYPQAPREESSLRVMTEPPAAKAVAKPAPIPVAKPAPPRPKLADDPGPTPVAELLEPNSIKGWSISLGFHALLLLIMALWYFAPQLDRSKATIDTRLAGSEFGDEAGTELKGGLGMDTPLSMPEMSKAESLDQIPPTITSLPINDLKLEPELTKRLAANAAANGGGVNLSNPGAAGKGDGFGVARFGSGGENINGVQVKVGDPQFTLIWDAKVDLDLHVLEPGGSHIYWEDRNGAQGGELDVDNIDGYGPENINWGGGTGHGPPGEYQWYVHFYGARNGIPVPTRWKVRVKHAGVVQVYQGKLSQIGERSRIYKLKVEPRDGDSGKADDATKPSP